jgi:formate hydrogenlyase subunit 3/multisubunit Na+/H+ antiporter MnhD subunit
VSLVILLPLLHLLSAAVCSIVGRAARWIALGSWIVSAGLVVALDVAVLRGGAARMSVGGWPGAWGIELVADEASIALLTLLVVLHGCVLFYDWALHRGAPYYTLLQVGVAAASAVTISHDLFNLFVLLDLLTLVSYLLVGFGRHPRQLWASLKYLIIASFGMGLFIVGAAVVYEHVGSMNLSAIRDAVAVSGRASWVWLSGALLLAGAGVKAGVFLLSLWLPEAHAAASPAISALLSGVVVKMGALTLLRLSTVFPVGSLLTVFGLLTGLVGVLYVFFERDLKRMLAFSTLSQIGYALLAFGSGTPAGRIAGIAYLVAHGLFKALLFLGSGIAAEATGSTRIARLRAERQRIPLAGTIALLVGTLSIVGLPPLSAYWAKALISSSDSSFLLAVALPVLGFGTAASFAKLLPLIHFGRGERVARGRWVAVATLAAGSVLLGLTLPLWLGGASLGAGKLALSALQAVGVAVAGGLLYRLLKAKDVRLPQGAFFLEEAVLIVLITFLLTVALLGVA